MPNNPTNKITSEELKKLDKGERTIFKTDILENKIPNSQENYKNARQAYKDLINTKKDHWPGKETERHKKVKEIEGLLKEICMPYLNEWGAKILSDAKIDISINSEIKPFPCKPGAKWDDIKIKLISNEIVWIETPQKKGRYSYHDLRMVDKKSKEKPTKIWEILKLLAMYNGRLDSNIPESAKRILLNEFGIDYRNKLPEYTKRLNKHFKELFGIDDSIFKYHYKKHKAYITKIDFQDRRDINISDMDDKIAHYENERSRHDTEVEDIQDKLGISDEKLFYE